MVAQGAWVMARPGARLMCARAMAAVIVVYALAGMLLLRSTGA